MYQLRCSFTELRESSFFFLHISKTNIKHVLDRPENEKKLSTEKYKIFNDLYQKKVFSYPVNSLKTFNKEWQKLGMKICNGR